MTGLYVVRLELHEGLQIAVGALGRAALPAGPYLYVGSARRALEHRVARHQRKEKPLRWHIDYLTTHPACEVLSAVAFLQAPFSECALGQRLHRVFDASVPVPGFGASDCTAGCAAHLLLLQRTPSEEELRAAATVLYGDT